MTDRRPTLCVVAGPNGSGKTTTTIQLLTNEWAADSLYINPDNIAQEMFGDWNSPEAVLKAASRRFFHLLKNWNFLKKLRRLVSLSGSSMSAHLILR